MPVVCVDPASYADAGALMATVADGLSSTLTTLGGDLAGSGGMAGSDSSGMTWAAGYDRGAQAALAGAGSAVGAAGNVALRLHATGRNHAHADGASTSGGGDSSFPAAPATAAKPSVSVPSAAGGDSGGEPTGWSLISGLIGHAWPNGHQDRLRAAATAWHTAATSLTAVADPIGAAAAKADAQDSPEAPAAAATCRDLSSTVPELVAVFDQLGNACSDYADHLDAAHHAVTTTLVALLAAVAGTQIAGAVASFFSFGAAEVPTQAAAAAEVDGAAAEIDATLAVLGTEATAAAGEAEVAATSADVAAGDLSVIEEGAVEDAGTTEAGATSEPVEPSQPTIRSGSDPVRVPERYVDRPEGDFRLTSDREGHILDGHKFGSNPEKSWFPESWPDDKVVSEIEDIARDPSLRWYQQTGPVGSATTKAGEPVRFLVEGIRDGVRIRVIVQPGEGIVTGFPIG